MKKNISIKTKILRKEINGKSNNIDFFYNGPSSPFRALASYSVP
jgi:hypothetical protein